MGALSERGNDMNIDQIIENDKIYKRYAEKYHKPLYHFSHTIPDRILNKFYDQATIEEIALYYSGVLGCRGANIPAILIHLDRDKKITIPVVDGILTMEFWEKWQQNNLIAIMDIGVKFGVR